MTSVTPRVLTLIAELTYRCPLRCVYCSNPTQTSQTAEPLATRDWLRVIEEAEQLGALQVHFTGGEPLLFSDLEQLVQSARRLDLYTNLITSGVPLSRNRLESLQKAGLDHVQLSFQALSDSATYRITGTNKLEQKLQVARWLNELELPFTINIVLHRENIDELSGMLELAESLQPHRIEVANAQYLGWALVNRDRLLPSFEQLARARELAVAARERLMGKTDVLFVLPDYYAGRPRSCMQGWAQSYLLITPDGLVLPCHAARDLPGLEFDDVRLAPLAQIWAESPALGRFRGSEWQPEPCRSCVERSRDGGGCRCQAFALSGDASAPDPTCSLSPSHHLVRTARQQAERPVSTPLQLRRAPQARPMH